VEPRQFAIRVSEETLTDLHERLVRVRLPDEIPRSGWQYGTNLAYVKELVTAEVGLTNADRAASRGRADATGGDRW
jgi:hypothetical protein